MIFMLTGTLAITITAWGLGYWIHRRAESMAPRP